MLDEGYIKFDCDWTQAPPPDAALVADLAAARDRLFELGLIGRLPEGVDFGNASIRAPAPAAMIITGTQTGHVPELTARHCALVTDCDIDANSVASRGAVKPSSETLTHAAIYALDPGIGAVMHVHHDVLWRDLLGRIPTTAEGVPYGTPAMARDFKRLFATSDLASVRVAVMAGHPGGIVAFGADPVSAADRIIERLGSRSPTRI